jgi:hypothetical protein
MGNASVHARLTQASQVVWGQEHLKDVNEGSLLLWPMPALMPLMPVGLLASDRVGPSRGQPISTVSFLCKELDVHA